MKNESAPTHLDLKVFAQSADELAGDDALSNYERISQEIQGLGANRQLHWSATGELRTDEAGAENVWLHLTVEASLPLTCQRCLTPVDIAVAVNRSFRFVESEDVAEAQDEEALEDVLVFSRDFNLMDLIEDEVLMALPVVPRHEECPVAINMEVADPGFDTALNEKRNPFAVLAKLQNGKPS